MYKSLYSICVFALLLSLSIKVNASWKDYWVYTPVLDPKTDANLIPLAEGARPDVIVYTSAAELTQLQASLKSQGYVKVGSYLGHPGFKVPKNRKRALEAAEEAGATLVLAFDFTLPDFYAKRREVKLDLPEAQLELPEVQAESAQPATSNPFGAQNSDNPFAAAAKDPYVGVFESDEVKLVVEKQAGRYSGKLFYAKTGATYPASMTKNESRLDGSFTAGGNEFAFAFELDEAGTSGVFSTQDYSSTLQAVSSTQSASRPGSGNRGGPDSLESVIDEAIATARAVEAGQRGDFARFYVVNSLAYAGFLGRATQMIKETPSENIYREGMLSALASGHAIKGNRSASMQILQQISNPAYHPGVYAEIARYHAEREDFDAALAAVATAPTVEVRVGMLNVIALTHHKQGNLGADGEMLNRARELAYGIEDKDQRSLTLQTLASAYAAPLGLWDEALKTAKKISSDFNKLLAYSAIALAQHKDGERAGAASTFALADKRIRKLDEGLREFGKSWLAATAYFIEPGKAGSRLDSLTADYRSQAFLNIITDLVQDNEFDRARPLMDQLLPQHSAEMMKRWAAARANNGEFDKGLTTARNIEDKSVRAAALAEIAAIMKQKSES